jgi:hypothetical protein
MKRLLALFALVALFALPAQAQNVFGTGYAHTNIDSIAGPRGKVVTDLFGGYKYLENGLDMKNLAKKTLAFLFANKTDSVKVQGAMLTTVHKNAAGRIIGYDTTWYDVPVNDLYKPRRLVYGQVAAHQLVDTTKYWVSDVGLDRGLQHLVELDGPEFVAYRVVTGINDTGVVKFRAMGRKD